MEIFLSLAGKLVPLYIFVALGIVASRNLKVEKEHISRLLIYILVPIVNFHGTATVDLSLGILLLPLAVFCICVLASLLSTMAGKALWKDKTLSVIGYTCGTGNNGYFGMPLVLSFFGEQAFGIAVIAGMGFLMFEVTLGLYSFLRHEMTPMMAVRKILRFPLFVAFILGIAWNVSGFAFSDSFTDIAVKARGAYTLLGMMLVGMGLGSIRQVRLDWAFLALTFFAKFVLWPALAWGVLALDAAYFQLLPELARHVLFLLSIVPLAASTVSYAIEFRAPAEKAAAAVLFSTLFALFYIPLMVAWFL